MCVRQNTEAIPMIMILLVGMCVQRNKKKKVFVLPKLHPYLYFFYTDPKLIAGCLARLFFVVSERLAKVGGTGRHKMSFTGGSSCWKAKKGWRKLLASSCAHDSKLYGSASFEDDYVIPKFVLA